MVKFSGKLINVGITKEVTPGAGGTPNVWFKWDDLGFQNKANVIMDESANGRIESVVDTDVTAKFAEGPIGGKVAPISIGWLLILIFGQDPVTTGAAAPYVHNFSVLNSNQSQSAAITIQRPSDELQHKLCYMSEFSIDAAIDDYVKVSTNLRGRAGEAVTQTATFIEEKGFLSNQLKLYQANEGEDPTDDPNVCLKSVNLTITREQEEDRCMSDINSSEMITNKFKVTGSIEVTMEDSQAQDDYMNSQYKALVIEMEDADGNKLRFDLPRVSYTDWTPAMSIDNLTRQTIQIEATYSITEGKTITAELTNTQASYA